MKLILSILALAAAWTAGAQGTSEAILNYSSTASGPVSATAGWTFQTAAYINVTDLGCFADVFVNNPVVTKIQVGLWDSAGDLIASNSVSSTSTLYDQTRYESITPVLLSPGANYHIGVFYSGGIIGLDVAGASFGGSLSNSLSIQLGALALAGSGFTSPAEQPGTTGAIYAGPNFRYSGGVPEPSSCLLLGLGGLLLAARRRSQRP
jgi:hypothetical protein